MSIDMWGSLVTFVILSFCNPAFPCSCRDLDLVEVIQQVALDKEEVEREERTASVSAGLLLVVVLMVVVGKNQVAGLVPRVAAVLVDP